MPAPLNERTLRDQRDTLLSALTNLSHACTGATQAMMEVFDHLLQETAAAADAPAQTATSHGVPDEPEVPPVPKAPATQTVKERKVRKMRDPNEPKKPMTIYFMWLQTHRAKVREEMGSEATRQQITDELKRRWDHEVSSAEKERLQDQYAVNRTAYRADMETFKSGHHEGTPGITEETPKAIEAQVSDDSNSSDDDSTGTPLPPKLAPKSAPAKAPVPKKQKQDATTSSYAKTAAPSMDRLYAKDKKNKQAKVMPTESAGNLKKSAKAPRSTPSSAPAPASTSTPAASSANTYPSSAPQGEKKKRKRNNAPSGEPVSA